MTDDISGPELSTNKMSMHIQSHTRIPIECMDVMCFSIPPSDVKCIIQQRKHIALTTCLHPPTIATLVPIKHIKKTGWMIIEKLISKWHASVGLVLWQMGIVRAMLIHPGTLTSTLSAIRNLWAAN